ncbi:MAG: prephenate dehydratase domain-containing protein [Polyangiales bacterium]
MSEREEVEAILASIEAADETLGEALDARARAFRTLAALRERNPDAFIRLPRDEEQIAKVRERLRDFPAGAVEPVLRELLSVCASLLAPRLVAFLGDVGGFAHLAARRQFGRAASYRAVDDVPNLLLEVGQERASFGVLPLETSSDGAVTETLLGLAASDVRICAEISVKSRFHLFSGTGNPAGIDKVYGTRAALAACSKFLRRELPRATIIDVPSPDMAAELGREDHGAGIVGTEMLAELFDLAVAHEGIEDRNGVETRYAVVSTQLPSRTGHDRTVIAMAVHDTPGALYESLKPFASRAINLKRVESRPTPTWRYLFFVEMDGHVTDRAILTALEELRGISRFVQVIGSYPLS